MLKPLPVLALVAFSPLVLLAQAPKPLPGDERIEAYLKKETERLSGRFLDGAKTKEEWEARRPRLRREYLDMLGLWPLPERTALHATVTGTVDRGDFVIEKLHYQSRPGLYVTGNLYRPKQSKGKLPAILYVCGHSGRGRDGNKTAFQDHGMWFASNGYVCLIVDSLQLGEIPGVHHGTYGTPYRHFGSYGLPGKDVVENRWWWQARGYTPAGVECWNGVRGLDYLVSRPDVDPERLGVTGISGGGAATFWIAAADERVRCAVPVSGMSDLESYVSNKVINGHCDCMFLVNTYQWHWTTIAALMAPRPLLFANSDNDRIFPMDGNRRIIARLRKLYTMYGKPDLVGEYISKGGHDDRPDLRVAAFRWMNRHLKNDTAPVKHEESKPLPGPQLRVFPEVKDVPKDALNAKIDETFVPKGVVKLPEEGKFAEWKTGLVKELREKSFRRFPERIPPADARPLRAPQPAGWPVTTEPGIELRVWPFPREKDGESDGTMIVVDEQDKLKAEDDLKKLLELAKPYGTGGPVVILPPRGTGKTEWTLKSPPNYVARAHALLGATVDEGRVRDIAATVRWCQTGVGGNWKVVGRGQAGVLAAYAALFEPSIKEVILIAPPASHRDGPIFLNVLRVLDIPEALGLLAPRPLTLVNAKDKAFDRTARIYKLAGAADRLKRK
jgi:dienelactone hydrolase